MSVIDQKLHDRSSSKCELCGSKDDLRIHLTKEEAISVDNSVLVCMNCKSQIENTTPTNPNHWRCLSESMWNTNQQYKGFYGILYQTHCYNSLLNASSIRIV